MFLPLLLRSRFGCFPSGAGPVGAARTTLLSSWQRTLLHRSPVHSCFCSLHNEQHGLGLGTTASGLFGLGTMLSATKWSPTPHAACCYLNLVALIRNCAIVFMNKTNKLVRRKKRKRMGERVSLRYR
ncbi:unnamed protein product [Amoebophrya sp. A120]|nr:unnamed protein product [Amoebophrya sp. A120]|eukprot:GSA120T00005614001.1